MASVIDIWNGALSECGARATVQSTDEASVEVVQCTIHYDRIRKKLLRAAPWGFAREQVSMSLLGTLFENTSIYPWPFKYQYPSDCLKFRYVLHQPVFATNTAQPNVSDWPFDRGWMPSRKNRFLKANDVPNRTIVLLTNVWNALGVYTADIQNVDQFDDAFYEALVASLAARLVIPLTGNVGMKTSLEQVAMQYITDARVMDGNEARPTVDHVTDWIATRGNPASSTYGLGGPWSGLGDWYSGYDNFSWGD